MKRILSRILVVAAFALVADRALAQTTAQLNITAAVKASCKVTTTTSSVVINYDPIAQTGNTGTTSFFVACTKGLNVWVAADGGLNATGGTPTSLFRNVKSGTDTLGYKLAFTASSPELAVGTSTNSSVITAGRGADVEIPMYVALDTAADPNYGSYTDTVQLTFSAQ